METTQAIKDSTRKHSNSGSRFDVIVIEEEEFQKESNRNHADSSSPPKEPNSQTKTTKETQSSLNGKSFQVKDTSLKNSQKPSPRSMEKSSKSNGPSKTSVSNQVLIKEKEKSSGTTNRPMTSNGATIGKAHNSGIKKTGNSMGPTQVTMHMDE